MSAYSTVIQVRFGHVDPAGIAYFPRIFDYVHDVFEEVGRCTWGLHYHLLLEERVGFLVHSEVLPEAPAVGDGRGQCPASSSEEPRSGCASS